MLKDITRPAFQKCTTKQYDTHVRSVSANVLGWSEVDGVGLEGSAGVLPPEFDRLVGLGRQQPRAGHVKAGREDARLALQRPRLHNRLPLLEAVAALPVPEPAP